MHAWVRAKAVHVFGAPHAEVWLLSPNYALDGRVPFTMVQNGDGQEVLDLLHLLSSSANDPGWVRST